MIGNPLETIAHFVRNCIGSFMAMLMALNNSGSYSGSLDFLMSIFVTKKRVIIETEVIYPDKNILPLLYSQKDILSTYLQCNSAVEGTQVLKIVVDNTSVSKSVTSQSIPTTQGLKYHLFERQVHCYITHI